MSLSTCDATPSSLTLMEVANDAFFRQLSIKIIKNWGVTKYHLWYKMIDEFVCDDSGRANAS